MIKTVCKYSFLTLVLLVLTVMVTSACPNCKDAFTSGPEATVGESYSWSILFMLGMFFSVIGGFGLLIWSKARKTNFNM